MFLSYAVVPVFVFTVLLNFFCLYSPIDSFQCGQNFTACKDCLQSECHTTKKRPCTVNKDNTTFQCFTCDADSEGNPQYYSEPECKKGCTDQTKVCACDGACFVCVLAADKCKFVCDMPTHMVDENCKVVEYCGSSPP